MVNWEKALEKMEERTGRKMYEGLYENLNLEHLIYVHGETKKGTIRYENCDGTYTIHEMTMGEFKNYTRVYQQRSD